MTNDELIQIATTTFVNHLQSLDKYYTFSIRKGSKYMKVVQDRQGGGSSVHCFIDKVTGDVYKPAGWATPVKDPRYNVVGHLNLLQKVADPYGGYLYATESRKHTK